MPFPIGRYPCCSQRAHRFEVLPNYQEGCRYKVEYLQVVHIYLRSSLIVCRVLSNEIKEFGHENITLRIKKQ